MRTRIASVFAVIALLLGSVPDSWSQVSGDYQSAASGNWNAAATWQTWNGSAWIGASTTPDSTQAVAVTILTGHNVSINASVGIGSLTVNSGGTLTLTCASGTTLTVASTAVVMVNGTFTIAGTVTASAAPYNVVLQNGPTGTGSIVIAAGGAMNLNAGGTATSTKGFIPAATWQLGSILNVNAMGGTAATGWGSGGSQNFYDINYSNSAQTSSFGWGFGAANAIHSLSIASTGTGRVQLFGGSSGTLTVTGDVTVTGGSFTTNGTSSATFDTVKHYGNLTASGGGNVSISRGSQGGAGTAVWILYSGNMALTGVTTQNSNPTGGKFLFAKAGEQTVKLSGVTVTALPVEVAGGTTLNLDTNVIGGSGMFTVNSGAGIVCGHPKGLNGNIATTGTVSLGANANITYGGTAAQLSGALLPTSIKNLTVTNNSGVTLCGPTTVTSALVLTGKLRDSAFAVTVKGNISNTGIHSSGSGMIVLSGGTAVHTLSGDGIYGKVTLGDSLGALLNGNPTVNDTLRFTAGIITTGTNTLTAKGAIVGYGSGKYVDGNLAMAVPTTLPGVQKWPLGQAGDSLLFAAYISAAAGNDLITVTAVDRTVSAPAGTVVPAHQLLKRFYRITVGSGLTSLTVDSLQATYVRTDAAELNLTQTALKANKFSPTEGWNKLAVKRIDTVNNILTTTGLTSSGDVVIAGTDLNAVPSFATKSVAFGIVSFPTTKIDSSVIVTNTAGRTLNITGIVSSKSVFTISPATASIALGGSQTFKISYVPVASASDSGSIIFTSDAMAASDTVMVKGTGVIPSFGVAPKALSYSNVMINAAKKDSVTVVNGGTTLLVIDSVVSSNTAFAVTPASATVTAGANAKFYVTFTAATGGTTTGNLVFYHNAASRRDTVMLSGSTVTAVTIAEARKDANSDLIPDHSITNDTLLVYGIITSPNYQSTQTSYFMQDATGGINVFSNALVAAPFAIGDSVFVLGTVKQNRGLTELVPLGIDSARFGCLKHKATVPTPMRLSLHDFVANAESYEGQLIEVDTLYKAAGTWPTSAVNASVYVTNKSKADTAQMFLDLDMGIYLMAEPQFPINVIGIAGQYSSASTVYNNGYEIMPRDTGDIKHVVGMNVHDVRVGIPATFALLNNYPNPFNPSTSIRYALPSTSAVTLRIYNVVGQMVSELVNSEQQAGWYTAIWTAPVASGVYFYRIEAASRSNSNDHFVQVRKMQLVK